MLHQQLKEQTLPSHQALEKNLVAKIKEIRSVDEYVQLLKLMYGYYFAIEKKIDPHVNTRDSINFNSRRKAESILNDIHCLAHDENKISLCEDLPLINSYTSALGALYVLEGSTLGGKIIARMISHQLKINSTSGLSFFLGYGDQTQERWNAFKENLTLPFSDTEKEEIIKTANSTFVTFKNWIDKHATN